MARGLPSYALGNKPPGSGFSISRSTINRLADLAQDAQSSRERAHAAVDNLVQGMAYFTRSEAMRRSGGPVAPRGRSNPALAYRIPVQRITGAYYAGWYVRSLGSGVWAVGNRTKEAYLIETGLFQRVRRPILKLSVISMLRFMQTTRLADMMADSLIAPRRNARGQFQSFAKRIGAFKLNNPPLDMPTRGARNPHISGPSGALP